jgi:hypothetical protein
VAHAFADISGLAAQAGRVHQTVNTMNDPKWAISSLLKNLVVEVFSLSVLSFRCAVREWFGFFYLPSRLVEATCHVVAIRFRKRHRL